MGKLAQKSHMIMCRVDEMYEFAKSVPQSALHASFAPFHASIFDFRGGRED